MNTISDVELAQVTGGKGPDATTITPSGNTGSSGNNDAVLSALNGIQSSLKDLGYEPPVIANRSALAIPLCTSPPASHCASRTSHRLSSRWIQYSKPVHCGAGDTCVAPGAFGPHESCQPRAV